MAAYTWFYINENKHMVSPFFDTEQDAKVWFNQVFEGESEPNVTA
jgi:hypothetical protein